MDKLTIEGALDILSRQDSYVRLLRRDTGDIGLYRPDKTDPQTPHKRDEAYVIATGTGEFFCDGKMEHFKPGDVFFVAAGVEHRFMNFSEDFSTWVIFFGKTDSGSS